MPDVTLQVYRTLADFEQRNDFRSRMETKGYFAFFAFVEEIKDWLKSYGDPEKEEIVLLLRQLQNDFPVPERFSPSWARLWDELQGIAAAKNELLGEVPHAERDGEWQVQIDNPYTPEQAACYPGLRFAEAAYLFAYFQQDLKPNENLRLQKVSHVRIRTGRLGSSASPGA